MGTDRARATELSPREVEVIELVVDGLSNKQIAGRLGISGRTVRAHIGSAMEKTGTRTRTQLAVHALRTGLVALGGHGAPGGNS